MTWLLHVSSGVLQSVTVVFDTNSPRNSKLMTKIMEHFSSLCPTLPYTILVMQLQILFLRTFRSPKSGLQTLLAYLLNRIY